MHWQSVVHGVVRTLSHEPPTGDIPDDSLTTLVDTHMLDRDLLLCASSVRLQRLEL